LNPIVRKLNLRAEGMQKTGLNLPGGRFYSALGCKVKHIGRLPIETLEEQSPSKKGKTELKKCGPDSEKKAELGVFGECPGLPTENDGKTPI